MQVLCAEAETTLYNEGNAGIMVSRTEHNLCMWCNYILAVCRRIVYSLNAINCKQLLFRRMLFIDNYPIRVILQLVYSQ